MGTRRAIVLAVLVAAVVASIALEVKLDSLSGFKLQEERYLYLPSGEHLRLASLGFDAVLADFFWVQAVLYFGKEYLSTRRYDWLYHLLDVTTTLDPRFSTAYIAGAILLSMEAQQPRESVQLLEKGLQYIPDDWRIPYFIGFNYFFFLDDRISAARYIERASRMEGGPAYLPRLAARLYQEGGEVEQAVQFLREAYRNSQDRHIRSLIKERLLEMGVEVEGNG